MSLKIEGKLKMGAIDLPLHHQEGGVCILNIKDGDPDTWPILVPSEDGESVEMQIGNGDEKTMRVTLPVGTHIEAPTSTPHTKYIIDIIKV